MPAISELPPGRKNWGWIALTGVAVLTAAMMSVPRLAHTPMPASPDGTAGYVGLEEMADRVSNAPVATTNRAQLAGGDQPGRTSEEPKARGGSPAEPRTAR
jgi:hypothetical protein